MKKTVTKLTLGLTSTAILATVGAQTVHANSYVVQDGDSFYAIATANGMDPHELAALNGKTIFDTIHPGDVLEVSGSAQASSTPWASNWWGNANTWAIYASAQGYKTGSVPVVGAIAVWDGGEYGHVAYVTDVQSENSIQVLEANYRRQKQIANYRGFFNPHEFLGNVTYIYPN